MPRPLVPELHDVGKLWRITDEIRVALELGDLASQEAMRILPGKLGLVEPKTDTWRGIVEHTSDQPTSDVSVLLLKAADHAGSSLRGPKELKIMGAVQYCSVHRLWNPADQQDIALLTSKDDLTSLLLWLATDPDADDLFQRYGPVLDTRPEELMPPLNVTSLASHLTIVGKIYRFLYQRRDRYAKATGAKDVEKKPVDLVKARVVFAQQIVRTRDMALFDILSRQITALAQDDRVLVSTFNEVLAILSPEEEIESLFAGLIDAGLEVVWESARTEIGDLKSTPSRLRHAQIRKLKSELDGLARKPDVPASRRREVYKKRWARIDTDYQRGALTVSLQDRFPPPICDVCQMEPASRLWPEDSEAPGPRENIGERCYRLRQNAPRLFKLDRWTQQPSARVAWVYVGLDLDCLVAFLQPLYQEYARGAGLTSDLVAQIDVRPPLLAEFQKDYRRFLADFAASVEEWIGADNLERVGGETGEAANTLFCLRLESGSQIPALLHLYLDGVQRYFPVTLEAATAATVATAQPFRLAVSVSGVKFPFSEHWRIMQEETADVLVNVIGRGPVRAPLASLPILIEAGRPSGRTALHNLAEVAKVSESLARVYAQNRGEKHYEEYQSLIERMRPLGMTYESLVAYAKLLEG